MLNLNSELVLAKKAATTAGKILQEKKVEINRKIKITLKKRISNIGYKSNNERENI